MKNETHYIFRIGDRELLTCENYLNQLCRYAEDGKITIDGIWKVVADMNHDNAVAKFQKIESEWINKPLGTAEKKQLAETLNVIRSNGKKASWNTIKPLLVKGGYKVEESRTSKARFSVIVK